MEESEECYTESISDEILLRIFQFLPAEDIFRVVRVSKRFQCIAQDATLHSRMHFGKSGENLQWSSKVLQIYIHKHAAHLKSFIFLDCYWITPTQMGKILKPCHNLQEVDLIGCEISLSVLDLLFQNNRQLSMLGWSIPCKDISDELYGGEGEMTGLHERLRGAFLKLSSLRLRFHRLLHFETILCLFPNEMTLKELSLEYKGQKSTSIIHSGSDYSVHIKSNHPFPAYLHNLHSNNLYLHFNLILMDFVTKVALHAAETDQVTVLLAPGSRNSLCWKYIAPSFKTSLLTMIDLSSTCLTAEQMNWLGNLTNLTYMNLQHVQDFKANLMKAIAANCPKMKSLNLNNCADWVDEDLCALKMVSSSCPQLEHLNVGRICCHSDASQSGNLMCKIIAQMKKLKSLSISPCCLVNSKDEQTSHSPEGLFKKMVARRSSLVDTPPHCSSSAPMMSSRLATSSNLVTSSNQGTSSNKGTSSNSLTSSAPSASSGTMTTSFGYVTRHVTHQQEINERVLQLGSGLDELVDGLNEIEQLELVGVGYSSVFSVPDDCSGLSFVCPRTRGLHDAAMLALKKWTKLKSLTLAGLHGLGSFNSLVEITKHCQNLEYLSLASIGLPGNAMALSSLLQALKNCHRLKKLRVDQAHYNLTEKLLTSLHSCKRLESICIICKDGKIPKEIQPYLQLFDMCKRLCVFQLFSGASAVLCKKIQRELIKRYQKPRPPLSVVILHFSQSLTEDGLQTIPFAHLKTLTCFETKIGMLT